GGVDSLEDELGLRIRRLRRADEVRAAIEPLGRESDAEQLLGRAPAPAPKPAALAIGLEVQLPRQRFPGARPGLAAAHLPLVRLVGMPVGHPVEAIAAEIHAPPAACEIRLPRLQDLS